MWFRNKDRRGNHAMKNHAKTGNKRVQPLWMEDIEEIPKKQTFLSSLSCFSLKHKDEKDLVIQRFEEELQFREDSLIKAELEVVRLTNILEQVDAVKQFDQADWADVDMVADFLKCKYLNKQLQDEIDSQKIEAENEKAQLTADLAEAENEKMQLTTDLAECIAKKAEFETALADQKKNIDVLQAELANYKQVDAMQSLENTKEDNSKMAVELAKCESHSKTLEAAIKTLQKEIGGLEDELIEFQEAQGEAEAENRRLQSLLTRINEEQVQLDANTEVVLDQSGTAQQSAKECQKMATQVAVVAAKADEPRKHNKSGSILKKLFKR